MSAKIMETTNLIHYLQIIDREITIEGNEQRAIICQVIKHHLPNFIEDLRELNEYRKKYGKLERKDGKKSAGFNEEANRISVRIHQPRHTTMPMWDIPD